MSEEEKEVTPGELKSSVDKLAGKLSGFGKSWLIGWGFCGFLFLLSYFLNRKGGKE